MHGETVKFAESTLN